MHHCEAMDVEETDGRFTSLLNAPPPYKAGVYNNLEYK